MPKKLTDFVASRSKDRTPEIRAYLRKLGNRYVDQLELVRTVGISTQHLGRYRGAFADHLVPSRTNAGRPTYLWAGTAKLAKQMRSVA